MARQGRIMLEIAEPLSGRAATTSQRSASRLHEIHWPAPRGVGFFCCCGTPGRRIDLSQAPQGRSVVAFACPFACHCQRAPACLVWWTDRLPGLGPESIERASPLPQAGGLFRSPWGSRCDPDHIPVAPGVLRLRGHSPGRHQRIEGSGLIPGERAPPQNGAGSFCVRREVRYCMLEPVRTLPSGWMPLPAGETTYHEPPK